MGWFGFGGTEATKPSGSTVGGYGGRPYSTVEKANNSFLSGIGQTFDATTGICGRTAQEAHDKAVQSGMSRSDLEAFDRRITAHRSSIF